MKYRFREKAKRARPFVQIPAGKVMTKVLALRHPPIPRVVLRRKAIHAIHKLVDLAHQEVSWLGSVERQAGKGGREIFVIEDIFLLKQEVGSAEATITEEGLNELAEELLVRPDGVELWNKIRFWGHSHVNMGASASFQDDRQVMKFGADNCSFFVRGIFNRGGRAVFDVFDWEKGLAFLNVPWIIAKEDKLSDEVVSELKQGLAMEYTDKVRARPRPVVEFTHEFILIKPPLGSAPGEPIA